MSINDDKQTSIMTLRVFDSQDDSMLGAIQNMSPDSREEMTFNYLQDCMSSLESKDSGINLSPVLSNSSNADLRLENLDKEYKSTDLSNIEFNFIKIENILLQNVEQSQNCLVDESLRSEPKIISINNLDLKDMTDYDVSFSETIKSNIFTETKKPSTFEKSAFQMSKGILETSNKSVTNKNDNTEVKFVTSSNEDDMKMDNSEALNKEFKTCGQCSMTFRYKRHLDRHLEGHQKNNCSHCNAKFARRKHLEVHLFRSHGERVTKYPHSCEVCSRSFPKRVLLNRHRAKHNYENGKVCSECGEMLKAEVDDKEHKENYCTKRQFRCIRCLQTFCIEQTYLAHIQNHNNYKCSECDVAFASKKKAHEHYKTVHAPKLGTNKVQNSGVYFCADCRHTFLKKDDYTRHLDSASHLGKISRDVPVKAIYTCSICSKKLISQRALDQHIRRTHKGHKRFACNIYGCMFQCARRTDLDRHKQLHVEQRNIVCEHCGKTFTSVSILNDHVLYVHNKERQFICEECGKSFKRNSLLKRHKLSHQQYRPFACMQCSTAFKRSHHLTRHMETCHRITLERKKKVVKLMKTEDGRLIPVPEKPRKLKPKRIRMKKDFDLNSETNEKLHSFINMDTSIERLNSSLELESLSNSNDHADCSNLSLEFTNLLPNVDSTRQVLSLVDVNSGQVVTVEVANPDTSSMNNLVDQYETNCSEMLNLPSYQDLEFQSGILNTDQNFYDQTNYSDLPLGSVEETSLLLDSNPSKMDSLPTIENYLTQSFPSFLNL